MKNWILSHKKVYFFIVGLIAFIAFMAITLHGVKRASAATHETSVTVPWGSSEVTVSLGEYDYYVVLYDAVGFEGYSAVLLSTQPFYVTEYGHVGTEGACARYYSDGRQEFQPLFNSSDGALSFAYGWSWSSVRANHDVYYQNSDEIYISANPFISPAEYIFDLDYTFDDVYYRQSLSIDNEVLWTLYFDRNPDIVYPSLQNYYIDVSYRFVLPSLDLLQDIADLGVEAWSDGAVDLWRFSGKYKRTYDYQASYLAPQGYITLDDLLTNLRKDWQSFYGTALDEKLLYFAVRYAYPQVTAITYREIGTDGNFHMGQTAVLESYEYYTKLWNGLIMPSVLQNVAVNTHGVPLDYIIPLADVNAKNDYDELLNQYQQEVDKNNEFEQALKDAQAEVQRAEEALKKAHEDMGLSGFLDIFDNIAKAFESASGALTSVASAIGSVFSFMPPEITGCLYFVFIFLLFVAIYKAIRG